MKSMTVGEFKAHFSDVIEQVKAGEQIEVTYGKRKEVIGYFQPNLTDSKPKRKLGILEGKATAIFMDDWEMTEEEFLGL
ncbi:prevent-host-death family protein [Mucilaginibacter gracilis]|uniref:Prevent-host-death family protein n=1 Tax=Mucilaginibacter gracilis TaxID=423350 RepID=A0A495IYP7_9SPHI|nr:type II toxin-antitoxin system prevent-host-death family antitoxin [Mucilaginibacter gracilis]RKR81184.1 prevent-host-death family protein [Mucilaginibacter gracilis]